MAVVLNPLMSEQVRGTASGLTFRRWRGLDVVSRKGTPVRRARGFQSRNRSLLGFLAREWGDLTDVQREAWRDYAANHPRPDGFGGTFQMTGEQAYISLNHGAVRLWGMSHLQTDPPVADPVASIDNVTAVTGAAPGSIDVTWTQFGTGLVADFCDVWVSRPYISPGRVEVHEQYHHDLAVAGNILLGTVDGLQEGAWYWVKVSYIDQYGQRTAWVLDQAQASVTP